MADKVLRFSADDSGYGATIDRMAAKLKSAFSSTGKDGMTELLEEADTKFTNFADKVKFIKEQLAGMKESNKQDYGDEGERIYNLKNTPNKTKEALFGAEDKKYKEEQKGIDRLVEALDKLSDRVENEEKRGEAGGGDGGDNIVDKVKKALSPDGEKSGSERFGEHLGESLGGSGGGLLIGSALTLLLSNLIGKIFGFINRGITESVNQLKNENEVNRGFRYNSDDSGQAQSDYYRDIGITGSEGIKTVGDVARSRRRAESSTEADRQAAARLGLEHGAGIDMAQISALDKLTRYGPGGSVNNTNGFDPNRTIIELLQRISKPGGFIDIDQHDFLLAPEKIDQLTQIMQAQYARTGETDPNTAINLIKAGQALGGRFAGNQAGEAYNNLGSGISNPSGDAMTAIVNAALHARFPDLDPYELKAQRQKGLGGGNLEAVLGTVQGGSKIAREAFFDNLTGGGNTTDALALAKGDKGLLAQLKERVKTDADAAATQERLRKSAVELTTTFEKLSATAKGSLGGVAGAGNDALKVFFAEPGGWAAPTPSTNKIIPAGGK